jgi:membrane protease YdiL (CAAX protease family)
MAPVSSPAKVLRLLIWAAFLAFLILNIGQGAWSILLLANFGHGAAFPWSIPIMAVVLSLMWQYLGGKWWPRGTSATRHHLLRANRVSGRGFVLAFSAGTCAMIALAGCWIVFFEISRTPPNVLPDLSGYPLPTIVAVLTMSSLVSPIVEEIGFRGYCQQIMERDLSGPVSVAMSSLLFMLAHANHGWFWPKLLVYFLAGLVFGSIAYLTNSILSTIPVHVVGDIIFFTLIWPHDSTRRLVTESGAGVWFWIHLAQAAIFIALALLGFRRLAGNAARRSSSSNAARIATA